MHYVYLLKSKSNGKFYLGSTDDLKKRFYQHNHEQSIATKSGVPWDLVYYEAFSTKALALERERKLKHHGRGLNELKKRVGFCLAVLGAGRKVRAALVLTVANGNQR